MEEARQSSAKRIKYCGNCNPEIHPRRLRHIVERIAAATEHDILILVNGCSRECLSKGNDMSTGKTTVSLNASELAKDDDNLSWEG